ncbi:MAG: glycoside hydrolase family 99-like domain-containing protein [Bifidobacteriaceae bacterium]|jgi:hypothetical protein|nr:glycoside hydrolase family 99-like domain-containing protein [Bifidobacteriaceae bacterium]
MSLKAQDHADVDFVPLVTPATRPLIEARLNDIRALGRVVTLVETPGPVDAREAVALASEAFVTTSRADLLITLAASDTLSPNTFAAMAWRASHHAGGTVMTANEDRLFRGERIGLFRKEAEPDAPAEQLLRRLIVVDHASCRVALDSIRPDAIDIVPQPFYHYRVDETERHDNQIKPIAFYLPQFHRIPENDMWWGEGFTEWTNVRRGRPLFRGHYQPHVPSELGYYDLSSGPQVQERQAALAAEYGIYAFCYYHYWFAGRRLLDKPLKTLLANPQINFRFCLCWANEPWSRRWDGSDLDILMPQVHDHASDVAFITEALPILSDPRYVTIEGAPLLSVYRPNLFPDFRETAATWRDVCAENGIDRLHISVVQSFTPGDPVAQGADSGIEFPPHGPLPTSIQETVTDLDPEFDGRVVDYREAAHVSSARCSPAFPLFRGAMVSWDNTARRGVHATVVHHANPLEYKKWLIALVDATARRPAPERLIFINAWNEWAEGTHLEPDQKFGRGYLEATRDAMAINC